MAGLLRLALKSTGAPVHCGQSDLVAVSPDAVVTIQKWRPQNTRTTRNRRVTGGYIPPRERTHRMGNIPVNVPYTNAPYDLHYGTACDGQGAPAGRAVRTLLASRADGPAARSAIAFAVRPYRRCCGQSPKASGVWYYPRKRSWTQRTRRQTGRAQSLAPE